MLNLNCVICAELFSHTDDVHVTVCGHMFHYVCLSQWLERSKTCPQCRNRCSERNIIRLYFNLANLDTSLIDVGSLQEQVDNSKLQLNVKEKELQKAEQQIKELKDSQKRCMKTITGLEDKLKKSDFVLLSYMEQIKMLKTEAKVTDDLRKEVKSLKHKLEMVENVSCILAASNAEVEKLIKTEKNPKTLCVWVTTLKRELRNCESKKTDIRNLLRVVQSDLRREIERKKKLEEQVSQLESECYQLTEKLKSLEQSMPSTSNLARRMINGELDANNLKKEEKRLTISPTIKETVRKIEESNSPYLNIKSSSIGLLPYPFKRNQETGLANRDIITAHTTTKLAKLKVSPTKSSSIEARLGKTSSDLSEKYSIFKKPRLVLSANGSTSNTASTAGIVKPFSSNLVFNGFSGSEKIDPFAHNPSDDDVEIVDDTRTNNATKPLGSIKSNVLQLKKTNSASGSSLSDRLKSGGLRNFTLSNRDAMASKKTFPQLKKAHSIAGSSLGISKELK